jgi:hypothetical protein
VKAKFSRRASPFISGTDTISLPLHEHDDVRVVDEAVLARAVVVLRTQGSGWPQRRSVEMARTVPRLMLRSTRMGTYRIDLLKRIGD